MASKLAPLSPTGLTIVHLALAGYEGELVILSDNLREALARFRGNHSELR